MKKPLIRIRGVEKNDYQDIKKFISDQSVARYLTWEAYIDENKIKEYFNGILKQKKYPNETLAIDYNKNVIGTIHFIYRNHGCVQFGFGILPAYWHKGFGTAIVKESLKYIENSLWKKNIKELWADVNINNKYAIYILLKAGFRLNKKNIQTNRDRYILSYEKTKNN